MSKRRNRPEIPSVDSEEEQDEPTQTEVRAQAAPISGRTPQRARFTVMTGVGAGMIVALEKEVTTFGRGVDADVRFNEPGVSRLHSRVTRTRRGRYLLEDLGSKNGTVLNGTRISRHEIVDIGDRVELGPNLVLQFGLTDEAEEELARHLYEASTRDTLTRSYNRRYLLERFDAELSYARRHKTSLGIILFDLDHFKEVNDRFGHSAGDRVLHAVSTRVLELIRKEDTFGRYGGEEFAILVRGPTQANVMRFAERVREAIARLRVPHEGTEIAVTISLGVSMLAECGDDSKPASLLALADQRLYAAKRRGRNQVCGFSSEEDER
jgi:diguanylate cyclase (GGDEF)-like protein